MSAPAPILRVAGLEVRRGGREVLRGFELTVGAGELVALVGRNGCGKSTLLATIAGVLPPQAGRVEIDGVPVWRRRGGAARRALGYAPEAADAPGHLTAAELWALCAAARGGDGPDAAVRAALELDELARLRLDRMSLGQRRRACLGAAFLGPPRLLVLDEPDNGLAPATLDAVIALLRTHAAAGAAAILASHDDAWLGRLGARRVHLDAA
ncbi:MAG: ABC transporter ATP-binding protein [Kofleriaceae bacterium]|nr:ABC transporter ATP-binding protein [Kofleriaceae bacterium]